MTDKITCPSCGKEYKWKPALAGKRVRCRGCSEPFVSPDPQAAQQDEIRGDIQDDYELDIVISLPPDVLAPTGKCPNCGNTLKPTAVICINCGFNLKEGKRIQTRTDASSDSDAPNSPSDPGS